MFLICMIWLEEELFFRTLVYVATRLNTFGEFSLFFTGPCKKSEFCVFLRTWTHLHCELCSAKSYWHDVLATPHYTVMPTKNLALLVCQCCIWEWSVCVQKEVMCIVTMRAAIPTWCGSGGSSQARSQLHEFKNVRRRHMLCEPSSCS